MLADPSDRRAPPAGRVGRTPRTTPCCTPTARCCRGRARRPGLVELPARHVLHEPAERARDLPPEPAPGPARAARLLRDAEPDGPDRARRASFAGWCTSTRSTRMRASPRRPTCRRSRASATRTTAARTRLGLPRGRLHLGPARGAGDGVRLVRSCLYEGQVVHERRTPVRHLFRYGVYMWLVDLDELAALDRGLWAFGFDRRADDDPKPRPPRRPGSLDPRERRRLSRHSTASTSKAARCSSSPTRACSATSSTRSRSSTATARAATAVRHRRGAQHARRAALLSAPSGRRAGRDRQAVLGLAVPHGRRALPDDVRAAR